MIPPSGFLLLPRWFLGSLSADHNPSGWALIAATPSKICVGASRRNGPATNALYAD
jgi:hypothetical protein